MLQDAPVQPADHGAGIDSYKNRVWTRVEHTVLHHAGVEWETHGTAMRHRMKCYEMCSLATSLTSAISSGC
jgi:hypothetical protein